MHQPLDKRLVLLLRHPALVRGLLQRDFEALAGRTLVVPLKGVGASEIVATLVAEVDFQRVRLRGLAMALKLLEVLQLRVRAEATFDPLDCPAREVGLRSLEEHPELWFEYTWYLEELVGFLLTLLHHAANMVLSFLINTPLDPSWLPIRSIYRPILLETRSRQELVVNSLQTRGREPLRSASRLLGFTIDSCVWDPGHRLVASPSCGPLCLLLVPPPSPPPLPPFQSLPLLPLAPPP